MWLLDASTLWFDKEEESEREVLTAYLSKGIMSIEQSSSHAYMAFTGSELKKAIMRCMSLFQQRFRERKAYRVRVAERIKRFYRRATESWRLRVTLSFRIEEKRRYQAMLEEEARQRAERERVLRREETLRRARVLTIRGLVALGICAVLYFALPSFQSLFLRQNRSDSDGIVWSTNREATVDYETIIAPTEPEPSPMLEPEATTGALLQLDESTEEEVTDDITNASPQLEEPSAQDVKSEEAEVLSIHGAADSSVRGLETTLEIGTDHNLSNHNEEVVISVNGDPDVGRSTDISSGAMSGLDEETKSVVDHSLSVSVEGELLDTSSDQFVNHLNEQVDLLPVSDTPTVSSDLEISPGPTHHLDDDVLEGVSASDHAESSDYIDVAARSPNEAAPEVEPSTNSLPNPLMEKVEDLASDSAAVSSTEGNPTELTAHTQSQDELQVSRNMDIVDWAKSARLSEATIEALLELGLVVAEDLELLEPEDIDDLKMKKVERRRFERAFDETFRQ